jgi:hypothetical protein
MSTFKIIKHRLNHEIVILDGKTTIKELSIEFFVNFFYGFLGNITTVFIMSKNPYFMSASFFLYYSFLSTVINRDKYETKLGKYFIFPISSMAGALTGCLLAFKYIHI